MEDEKCAQPCDYSTYHSPEPFGHAGSERAPVSSRAEHPVKHSQRCSAASPAKGQGGQFHSPVPCRYLKSHPL